MKKLKFNLDRSSLETMYLSFIRPLLEYGDVVFDNCTLQDQELLENVQHEAARIVTGATKNNLYPKAFGRSRMGNFK